MSLRAIPAHAPAWDPNDQSLWTVKECGRFLGMSPASVYHLVESGALPVIRIGRCVRFHPARIRAWVEDHEVLGRA